MLAARPMKASLKASDFLEDRSTSSSPLPSAGTSVPPVFVSVAVTGPVSGLSCFSEMGSKTESGRTVGVVPVRALHSACPMLGLGFFLRSQATVGLGLQLTPRHTLEKNGIRTFNYENVMFADGTMSTRV